MTRIDDGRIEQRVSFDRIRYANCWEDAQILIQALRPRPGMRILAIASAGDNVLSLLAEGVEVVAADVSRAQLACLELRCAAFGQLDYDQLLAFLGVRPSQDRVTTYDRINKDLSIEARDFWQTHPKEIENGVIHAGKFEAYFRLFRRRILPLIHWRSTVRQLLDLKDVPARQHFYDHVWNNWRWRLLFRVFYSRFVMGRLGRDPEFFRYVTGSVSDRILRRTKYALTQLPTDANPFLEYILTGNFSRTLPDYLQPDRFEAVRNGLHRLTLFHGSIEKAAMACHESGFDGFNLSDIFEYLSESHSAKIYEQLISFAKPGARLAYWNTFVPRSHPPELVDRIRSLDDLAEKLFLRDLAFFYERFVVEEVV